MVNSEEKNSLMGFVYRVVWILKTLWITLSETINILGYDDINCTPGYQVKIHPFVQLFILFWGAVFGFKKCKISL